MFHDRIYFIIASNPAKAVPHFGSYCMVASSLDCFLFGSHESGVVMLLSYLVANIWHCDVAVLDYFLLKCIV